VRTRVGYSGGSQADPTYMMIMDHTESIQIEFDPTLISYEELVREFFDQIGSPYSNCSGQYKSAVWYHDEEQAKIVSKIRGEFEKGADKKVKVCIEAAGTFYYAEDYHQKYYLRYQHDLMQYFDGWSSRRFTDSPLTSLLNAYSARPSKVSLERIREAAKAAEFSDKQIGELESILRKNPKNKY